MLDVNQTIPTMGGAVHDPTDSPSGDPPQGTGAARTDDDQEPAFFRSALYQRLHSHPVLAAATKMVVTVVGGAVLLVGVVMLVTPGPAVVMIPLGLAILATEWRWARRLLVRARQAAERARDKATAMDPATRRRRAVAAAVAAVCMVAAGVALALELTPGM
jgi:uncharacterized protein (TIGR02611 family)